MIKILRRYFRGRFERFYFKNRWHFVLDLSLLITAVCLAIGVIVLYLYHPNIPGGGTFIRPPLNLNNPPLHLEFALASSTINLDESITLKIVYKNSGPTVITNWRLLLETSDNNFSLDKIENAKLGGSYNVVDQSINFSKIPAGGSGEAEVKAYFKTNGSGRIINWRVKSEYTVSGQTLTNYLTLNPLKVKAELIVTDAAYYTSPQGDQLGIGPLPPLVGLPTDYWIFWEVQSINDWKNLSFSARLPRGVELTDNRSLLAGEFNYNPETRQLIWKLAELVGRPESYRLGFEVQLIPTAKQVGQILPFLVEPRYFAKDVLTDEEIGGALNVLTTNLNKDRFNSGQGRVVAE